MQILERPSDEKQDLSVFGNIGGQLSTVASEIQRHCELRPDQPAVVSSGFAPLSYRELQYLIDEIRTALRLAGFSRSSRIGIALLDGPQAALAIVSFACSAVAVPLNPKQTLAEIEMCLAVLRLDAILLFEGSDSAARRVAHQQGLTIIEAIPAKTGTLGFKIVVPQIRRAVPPDESNQLDPDAPAFILETSGTTSEPKLIPFSHRNMLAAASRLRAWFDLTPQDRCLSVSPAFYSHGLKVTIFTPLLTGGTVVFPADASKFDFTEWFSLLKPTWYSAGPTLHHLVYDQTHSRGDAKTGHSLRFILSGGAPLPRNILEGLQQTLGVPVVEHYGSSEAAQISANLPSPGRSKLGTCGIPWPGTVIIVGEDGHQLPPGERGEVLVSGPTVMPGYLDSPELNRASFVDGWLKTGDIGSLDEEGFLTLQGRLKDLINRGGEKILPTEIDEALMRHPAVAEAAAFAVPHSRLGEDIAAAIVLRPGMTATAVELRRYLGERLAPFKIPRRIINIDQLPKGTTGKILRRHLSETLGRTMAVPLADPNAPINSSLLFPLRELWERLLKSGPLTIDDDFFERGGDSLLAVEMVCEVERLIGKSVPSSILFEASTIRQLAQKLSEEGGLQAKPLIQLSSNGSQAPLVFFHGDIEGGGYYVKNFARLLGSDQPLFVIAPHGIDGGPIPRSIEGMAADRLPLIMNAQPQGPYRLAGFCIGGLVAFEAARMLVAGGKNVEMVIIIDSPTVNVRRSVKMLLSILARARPVMGVVVERVMARAWYNLAIIDRYSNLSASQLWWAWVKTEAQATFVSRIHRILNAFRANRPSVVDQSVNPRPPEVDPWRDYASAMSNYSPAHLPVRIIYFSFEYNGEAFARMSSDLEVIKLPGSHEAIITNPSDLALLLRSRLRGKKSGENPQLGDGL